MATKPEHILPVETAFSQDTVLPLGRIRSGQLEVTFSLLSSLKTPSLGAGCDWKHLHADPG